MDHGGDGRPAEEQRGGRAQDGMATALTAGGHRAAQLFQRVGRGFEAADAGLQQPPQVVLATEAAEAAGGVAAAVAVARAAAEGGAGVLLAVAAIRMTVGPLTGVRSGQGTERAPCRAHGCSPGARRRVVRSCGYVVRTGSCLLRDTDVIAVAGILAGFRASPRRFAPPKARAQLVPRAARPRLLARMTGSPFASGMPLRLARRVQLTYRAERPARRNRSERPARRGRVPLAGRAGRATRVERVVPATRRATHAGASIATRSAAMPRDP